MRCPKRTRVSIYSLFPSQVRCMYTVHTKRQETYVVWREIPYWPPQKGVEGRGCWRGCRQKSKMLDGIRNRGCCFVTRPCIHILTFFLHHLPPSPPPSLSISLTFSFPKAVLPPQITWLKMAWDDGGLEAGSTTVLLFPLCLCSNGNTFSCLINDHKDVWNLRMEDLYSLYFFCFCPLSACGGSLMW